MFPLLLLAATAIQSDPVAVPPRPKGPPTFQTNDDMRAGERPIGPTKVVLTISKRGRVEGCRVRESSGAPRHDALACRILSRLPFDPARSVAGKAVVAEHDMRMNWGPPQP